MKDHYDFSEAKRGPAIETPGKTRITIMLDDDVLRAFRERAASEGKGYQTLINETLRYAVMPSNRPITEDSLRAIMRDVLREETHG
jgi:uncharacterized protein (DUF4415 family)